MPTEDSLATLRRVKRAQNSAALPSSVSELYTDDGKLRPEFIAHQRAHRAIRRHHRRAGLLATEKFGSENGYKLPRSVAIISQTPLIYSQISHRLPFAVIILAVKNGKRVRYAKHFSSLWTAAKFHRKVKNRHPSATIVSRSRGYDIPGGLRGKLPRGWVWCPHCVMPRKYERHPDGEKFSAMKKYWSNEEQRYKWRVRDLYLLRCAVCHCTNRDPVYRRSNQPWEKRKIKTGARRVKARVKTRRTGNKRRILTD